MQIRPSLWQNWWQPLVKQHFCAWCHVALAQANTLVTSEFDHLFARKSKVTMKWKLLEQGLPPLSDTTACSRHSGLLLSADCARVICKLT